MIDKEEDGLIEAYRERLILPSTKAVQIIASVVISSRSLDHHREEGIS